MMYTLKLDTDSTLRNASYDLPTAPVVGTCRTIHEARKIARDYGDAAALFILLKRGKLNRYLRADGSDY